MNADDMTSNQHFTTELFFRSILKSMERSSGTFDIIPCEK